MKRIESLIAQWNTPETILVISKYPTTGVKESHHGVATYTRDLLTYVGKKSNQRYIVLIQNEYNTQPFLENNVLVIPTFGKTVRMYAELLKSIARLNNIKKIHIHSEFFNSGQLLQMALLIPFLFTISMMGKKVYYFCHNIINDFSYVAKQLGIPTTHILLKLLQLVTPLYYFLLSLFVTTVIVLDHEVFEKIKKYVPKSRLLLSPHWIYPVENKKKSTRLRDQLGIKKDDFVLICFGFMSIYKDVSSLINATNILNKKTGFRTHLILAGGKASSQIGKPAYEKYYRKLEEKVENSNHVTLTGFIEDKNIQEYFSISNLGVLPYKGILGASGSWAQIMAHGLPFLLSSELEPYLNDSFIKQQLNELSISNKEVSSSRKAAVLAQKINQFQKNPKLLRTVAALSQKISLERSPEKQLLVLFDVLFSTQSNEIVNSVSQQSNV